MKIESVISESNAYWDSFYARSSATLHAPRYPSQFAAFVVNELAPNARSGLVIEFGCGNGRDSEFFAQCGYHVVAMDASANAIQHCVGSTRGQRVKYLQKNVTQSEECLSEILAQGSHFPVIAVYARFFLHAINDDDQEKFLSMLGNQLPPDARLFFEYRTDRDQADRKAFGNHYRRFQAHHALLQSLRSEGFHVEYEVEGRGFAKYKDEDAVVGRCIARKI